ncbi:hypothetical protein MLD38_014090 [Melastoma candidum]|uniref:Uncharacterized protein n=1 Tax=Melastoma candidum TaxID=119954 RepID=A0ACB9RC81_9MYRT|nr:hypothetical protein MLD38_014090 [Melastoma candidum]
MVLGVVGVETRHPLILHITLEAYDMVHVVSQGRVLATCTVFLYVAVTLRPGDALGGNATLNVINFGAKGDGLADDARAFLLAWDAACRYNKSSPAPSLLIPEGHSFLVSPLLFRGPCSPSRINFQIYGTVMAPTDKAAWKDCAVDSWIVFQGVSNLVVSGSGALNARGSLWWDINGTNPADYSTRCTMPKALEFIGVTNLQLSGLLHRDSPRAHIRLEDTTNATLSNLTIYAPGNSPNTDGIVLSQSKHVDIFDCVIKTGDDCIAIKAGTSFVNITGVVCGPGHGISIGGLGFGDNETVADVSVTNSIMVGASNGARIKTWPNGAGYVRRVIFEDIFIINSSNPIIINQHYCDSKKANCTSMQYEGESGVAISNVTFRRIIGTAPGDPSITLDCSAKVGCRDILIEDVDIFPETLWGKTSAICSYATGVIFLFTGFEERSSSRRHVFGYGLHQCEAPSRRLFEATRL